MRTYMQYTLAAAAAANIPKCLSSSLFSMNNSTMVYDFSELKASQSLTWSRCYDNFTCALLKVPRDYTNLSTGTLNIAIIKRPGSTPDAQEVLVNPGGPGGSSVAMVLADYRSIQNKIGTEYPLIGIDPRGVNNSEPVSDCFPRYPIQSRNAFLSDAFSLGDVTSESVLRQQHQSTLAYGKWCTGMYSVNGTAKYASTVATAQDMLHYISLRAQDLDQTPEEAKLWYYGISYGSILGPTFASLYPHRIGRMIIDGVLDLQDYYTGSWKASIADSDKAAQYFFQHCFAAGSTLCSFHQNASSWQQIEQRYLSLVDDLRASPIGLGNPVSNASLTLEAQGILLTPYVLTWTDIVSQLFGTIYLLDPTLVLVMDLILVALQNRDMGLLSSFSLKAQISTFRPEFDDRMARALISCLDANGRSNYSEFGDYKNFVTDMYDKSHYGGLSVAAITGPICSMLDVQAPESQRFDGVPRSNGTAVPILFISSIADPITPLPSAKKMQTLFPGSGLLVFDNSGHAAHFQNVACVSRYEMQYMRSATLPPENTTCEVEEPNPWIILGRQFNLTERAMAL